MILPQVNVIQSSTTFCKCDVQHGIHCLRNKSLTFEASAASFITLWSTRSGERRRTSNEWCSHSARGDGSDAFGFQEERKEKKEVKSQAVQQEEQKAL